jgi:hypothetical protein
MQPALNVYLFISMRFAAGDNLLIPSHAIAFIVKAGAV